MKFVRSCEDGVDWLINLDAVTEFHVEGKHAYPVIKGRFRTKVPTLLSVARMDALRATLPALPTVDLQFPIAGRKPINRPADAVLFAYHVDEHVTLGLNHSRPYDVEWEAGHEYAYDYMDALAQRVRAVNA